MTRKTAEPITANTLLFMSSYEQATVWPRIPMSSPESPQSFRKARIHVHHSISLSWMKLRTLASHNCGFFRRSAGSARTACFSRATSGGGSFSNRSPGRRWVLTFVAAPRRFELTTARRTRSERKPIGSSAPYCRMWTASAKSAPGRFRHSTVRRKV